MPLVVEFCVLKRRTQSRVAYPAVENFDGMAGIDSADDQDGFTFPVVVKEFTADGHRYLN
jgi:hypothetical protein